MGGGGIGKVVCLFLVIHCVFGDGVQRQFIVDYARKQFLLDGKSFQVISGSMHYFNIPNQYWMDRLRSLKLLGVNTLNTYVEWSTHEPLQGVFNFENQADIVSYLEMAQSLGLLVNLRIGPFIDAERDMGGLPWWLLNEPNITLRSSKGPFLKNAEAYYGQLLPRIKPLLYSNGGPIILVQVENEYGSYVTCDFVYTSTLADMVSKLLGDDVVYFTTDGPSDSMLMCGKIEGTLTTVDFGVTLDVMNPFNVRGRHQLGGPLVNSEFYPGWLDVWGIAHQKVSSLAVIYTMNEMLTRNISFNMYMVHGGTHWNFSSGGIVSGGLYLPCTTSYDYDAPLNEAGDPTQKYFDIKKLLSKYVKVPDENPVVKPKMAVGKLKLTKIGSLSSVIEVYRALGFFVSSPTPLSMEEVLHSGSLVVYSTNITERFRQPSALQIPHFGDRGYVYLDGKYQGMVSRAENLYTILLRTSVGSRLDILVENQGRVSVGPHISDKKGIFGDVKLGSATLKPWHMYLLSTNIFDEDYFSALDKVTKFYQISVDPSPDGFGAYLGFFNINSTLYAEPIDTFVRLDGWSKGFVVVNGNNLGRYWPSQGPQQTLYLPGVFLTNGTNYIAVVEQEGAPKNATIQLVDKPDIDGPVPLKL